MALDIFTEIVNLLKKKEKLVLATVISRVGSAPRASGAKYLIREDGTTLGTVGGGGVEAKVFQEARDVLKTGQGKILHFSLTAKEIAEGGQVCGGNVDVFLEPLHEEYLKLFQEITETRQKGGSTVLATLITVNGAVPKGKGTKVLFKPSEGKLPIIPGGEDSKNIILKEAEKLSAEKRTGIVEMTSKDEKQEFLLEPLFSDPTVYIFGGGHISQQLAPLAKRVHFRVVVIDDREAYANRELFPEADEVIVSTFENCFGKLPIDDSSYIVIVTRGHLHDYHVLEQAIATPACYIGMIGSKRKIQILFQGLKEKGTPQTTLDRIHAPIGIEINSETPEEIAVSIVAELIKVRGEGQGIGYGG